MTMTMSEADPRFEDCFFYHTMDLPGHGVVRGHWDLRGREDRYTGSVDFAGRTVLEIGPASGALTAYMERRGARVACFETSDDVSVDILPNAAVNLVDHAAAARDVLARVNRAWHYMARRLGLAATMAYGDITTMPSRMEPVDIAVLGAILLHCRSPIAVVHQACRVAREAVVVTDLVAPGLETCTDSLMRFNPSWGGNLVGWWSLSPGVVVNMLALHGFPDCTTTFHEQWHHQNGDLASPPGLTRMFTVVGRRG